MPSDPYLRRVVIPGLAGLIVGFIVGFGAIAIGLGNGAALVAFVAYFVTAFGVQAALED